MVYLVYQLGKAYRNGQSLAQPDTPERGTDMASAENGRHDETTIIINTRGYTWGENKISFEQLVALAYPNQPITDQEDVTIQYSRGQDGHGAGTLTAGNDVAVKKGMVFDVYRATRS